MPTSVTRRILQWESLNELINLRQPGGKVVANFANSANGKLVLCNKMQYCFQIELTFE